MNAANYGVPQNRMRWIVAGTRKNTKSKNKKNKKNISLITAILLVTTILSVAVNVFLLVTDHKRTQSTVARIEAVD